MEIKRDRAEAIIGCLLGTAVGDALGLPGEGLSKARQRRLFGRITGHRFFCGRAMISDDTEHACLVAQALLVSAGDAPAFRSALAQQLRLWLLGLPAGTGKATLIAAIRLWLGFGPERSGIFSAGNGPAMRSALLGVCYGNDPAHLRSLVRASTRLTHTDPKAEYGAFAVALAAHAAASDTPPSPQSYQASLCAALGDDAQELTAFVAKTVASAEAGETTETFAESLGLSRGVTGYVYHTVPVVLHAWFRHPTDFRAAVLEVIGCGGDTDTTAAILGAIVGAGVGRQGIPPEWLDGLWEWPRSVAWMERLGARLAIATATQTAGQAVRLPALGVLLRNLLFLAVVLYHGFRRLLPPY